MIDELELGQRVETPAGPGTVVADDEAGRGLRSALSVCVQLDRPGARTLGRLYFAPDELQAVLV